MEFRDFTAGKDDNGRRLDRILRIFLPDANLSEVYKLIRKGLVKVNHKKAKPELHVNEGDIISIADFLFSKQGAAEQIQNNTSKDAQNSKQNLKIVFENEHILIIDKPYGRSVHGSENDSNGLDKDVLAYYEAKKVKRSEKATSLSFRPGPVHRLDRNTSGLLVFSMSLKGAHWFSEGIKNHTIHKKYYGLAQGNLTETQEWEDKLSDSDATEDGFYTVSQNTHGQLAQTSARPLAHGNLNGAPVTLVEFSIKTGRKHQIRAQSLIHKHPLAGDKAYGAKPFPVNNKENSKIFGREYYLQAFSLSFPQNNPLGLPEEIKIPLSDDFISLLQYCEIKNPGL